ncbi:MAG TPA: STAS domain-containing protein [Mycobacteriales bacterium]|nr:STAS domain-containing protein [Mycobacteriales bacterium]
MLPFEVCRRDEADHCLVAVHGEVDLATAPTLRTELQAVLDDEPAAVVLDLDAVPFLDSTGLGVLVAAYKRATALGIPLRLARPRRIVANALTLVRIDTVIPVHDTIEDAVAG